MDIPPLALIAGGLATRMGARARHTPKSLFEVAGEPFIAHQIRLFGRKGVSRIVVCAGHLGEQIRDFLGDGADFGVDVAYSFDGDRLLGTGGAIRKALPLLGSPFMVTYGDSYLDIDLRPVLDAFAASGLPALMTVYDNRDRWDRSNTAYANGRVTRHSKSERSPDMHYIDYGLGVFSAEAFIPWADTEKFDLSEVYGSLSASGALAGYVVTQRFYEIGSEAGLQELSEYLSRSHI